jgi:hypothetical protein
MQSHRMIRPSRGNASLSLKRRNINPEPTEPEGHAFRRAIKSRRETATALPKAGAKSEGRSDQSIAVAFHPTEVGQVHLRVLIA